MGIFDRFPYSSTHEMNLDFMLGKATEIAESLQEVQDGLSDIDTHKAQAEQAAQSAAQAAQAASASAGQSAQHVTDAEDAADRAETASTEAETAADRAEEALGNMTDSETVCLNAAARAEAAQAAVAESASAASSSAANASLNASQAATSAGSAANSATAAANSANSANVSATNASLHASNASTSATNAATSATNAATSATTAATNATNAAASANSAAESKEQIDTLVESLPEDFTDLNNKVNNLESAIIDRADIIINSASGAIANFPDGADDLPIKSLLVAIEPVQADTGWNGVKVTRTGVNVWDEEWEVGGISTDTGNNVTGNLIRSKNICQCIPNTQYYFGDNVGFVYWYAADGTYIRYSYGNTTYISPSNANGFRIQIKSAYGTTYKNDISINYPSTYTEYYAYQGQTYEITFPSEAGMVYGGSLDVITGILTVNRAEVDPVTYQLTPQEVKTLLGQNNIWADTGNTTVTYPADTKLYIDKKIAELQALILENNG